LALHFPRFFSIWRVNFNPLNPFDMPITVDSYNPSGNPAEAEEKKLFDSEALEHMGCKLLAAMLKELPLQVAECFTEEGGERLFFPEAGFIIEEQAHPDPTKEGNVIAVLFDSYQGSGPIVCFEEPEAAADFCRGLYLANYSTSY
jgi:hypothetical protein